MIRTLLILFFVSLLSATLLPGGSEVLLISLLKSAQTPWLLLIAAIAGNTAGSFVNYGIGRKARKFLFHRLFGFSRASIRKASARFRRYGAWLLFFSFVPFIGDPLTAVAGMLRYPPFKFLLWVFSGKTLRYLMVALIYREIAAK